MKTPQKFHERFAIKVDREDTERRFINRALNEIFDRMVGRSGGELLHSTSVETVNKIASYLGDRYDLGRSPSYYIENNFYRCLQAIEALYRGFDISDDEDLREIIDISVKKIIFDSELDLGIEWTNGRFKRKGAKLLDEKLVNESLRWLSDKRYKSVFDPFSKGLEHFLHVGKRPELLSDVITDMYEALEALAKIVTGRENKDLSANAGLFIKKLGASDSYKRILKEYISYANDFRHAAKGGKEKPKLSIPEVESFVYLTGLFIRLATQIEINP